MKSALIVTLLLSSPLLVMADRKEVEDRIRELGYRPPRRDFAKAECGDRACEIESSQSGGSKMEFRFTTEGVPRFFLRFKNNTAQGDKPQFAMRMGFFRLVEFNDTIRPRLSDRVLRLALPPPSASWSSLKEGLQSVKLDDGSTLKSIQTSLVFNNHAAFGNLNFTLKVYAVDRATVANDGSNVALTPDSFKYSVQIKDWPYKYVNGRLALIHGFWIRQKDARTNGTNRLTMGGAMGRFMWDKKIRIDGADGEITANTTIYELPAQLDGPPQDGEDQESGNAPLFMDFSFPAGGQNILWDPEFGFNSDTLGVASTSGAERMISSTTAMFAGAMAGLVAFLL